MNQIVDRAIVLKRQDFGEADRIVTFLTENSGKITGIVKGARRLKSKMSGGIELFGINNITFLAGKSDMRTIVSTRLETHFGKIATEINRTMWAYEALKFLDKSTEEECGPGFYNLAEQLLKALNDVDVPLEIVRLWFNLALLRELGHGINTESDNEGKKLTNAEHFDFSFETMSFQPSEAGQFKSAHIKLLRLSRAHNPAIIARIEGAVELANALIPLTDQAIRLWVR